MEASIMNVKLTVSRIYQHDCTVGVMNIGDEFRCMTLELPWKDNATSVSCIPTGVYECFKRVSGKNGNVFELKNVVNRSYIQCHAGNYTSQIEGCILVGDSLRDINNDGIIDVTNSKTTLNKVLSLLPDTFIMEIR